MTAETSQGEPTRDPLTAAPPRQARAGLARWALGTAIAALVVAVASPLWVPMLRGTPAPRPDPAVAAAVEAADRAARSARDLADKAAPLAARIEALESAVQRLATASAGATAAATPDIRRLALAGAVAQLRPAVARPTPFAVELAVVQGLAQGQDRYAAALRRLAPVAITGAPTLRQLRLRFAVEADAALMAEAATDAVPLAAQFVTWMATSAPFGSGRVINDLMMPATAAALERARERLLADDLANAVAALDGLGEPAATRMRPWIEGARARLAVTDAMDGLVRTALADLPVPAR